jgi:hypothetical protein
MSDYRITVQRVSDRQGTLTFEVDGVQQFKIDCWEDPGNRIDAKTYTECSTTLMATKGYKSVYLPDGQTGKVGIFIHPGSKPEHSDGCIVCATSKVTQIYNAVPRNKKNVTVVVKSTPVARTYYPSHPVHAHHIPK